jgi:diamine N-acetyltransferase
MEITYQRVTISDLDILLKLVGEFHAGENLAFNNAIDRQVLTELLEDELFGKLWLIYDKDIVIGYIIITFVFSIEFRGKIACIDEIYINKNYRDRGISTKTLQFAEKTCYELGIKLIYLEVGHNNDRAQQFYRQAGYRDLDYYLMIKPLN